MRICVKAPFRIGAQAAGPVLGFGGALSTLDGYRVSVITSDRDHGDPHPYPFGRLAWLGSLPISEQQCRCAPEPVRGGSLGYMMVDMKRDTAAVLTRLDKLEALERQGRWQRLASAPVRIPLWRAASRASRTARRPIPFRARTVFGDHMRVYAPEFVSQHIYERTVFEVDLTRTFINTLKSGWTVYDVGAHFGYFTLLASSLVGDTGSVHSFEPTPSTRRVLEHNTRGRPNVSIEDRAAWSSQTALDFNDLGLAFSAFNSAFSPRLDEEHASTQIRVNATTLDSYAARWGAPDFVKIDAESAESHVIAGMSGLLDSKRPILSVEVGDKDVPGVPTSREMIEQVLTHSYAVVVLGPAGLAPGALKDRYSYDNVLLVPAELVQGSRG